MLLKEFSMIFDRPEKVKKLREYILSLAVRGKLIEQDENDEPASVLLERIREEKDRLIKEKKIKKEKPLPEVSEDEIPYELPNGWEWVRLGELIFLTSGISYKKHQVKFNKDNGYGFVIRGGNIQSDKLIDTHDNTYVPLELFKEYHYLKKNDTIMVSSSGTRTSIGKSAFIEESIPESTVGAFLFIIRPYTNLNAKYIHYLIKIYRDKIIDISLGTNINNIKKDVFNSIVVPVPTLNEQNRIVEKIDYLMDFCDKLESQLEKKVKYGSLSAKSVLNGVSNCSSYEELEEALRFIIENFKDLTLADGAVGELKSAILSLAVKGKLVPQDESDEPASGLLERIREEKDRLVKEKRIKKEKTLAEISEDEIPYELPKGWEWVRLGELCKLITKGSSPKWQGINYIDNDNGVLFITSENVGKFNIILNNKKYLEHRFNEIEPRSILEKGDLLTNIVGASIGRTAMYDLDEVANINQAVCMIRTIDNSIYKPYLLNFFNSPICIGYMYDKQVDCARANLSMSNIARFLIPLPPLSEQKRIVEKVDKLMEVCDELELRIEESKKYNEKLMESMFKDSLKA